MTTVKKPSVPSITPGRSVTVIGAACILGASGVLLGAFGAHGLRDFLAEQGADSTVLAQRLDNWDTAVKYQLYHAIVLLVVGVSIVPSRLTKLVTVFLILGVLIFSGCLYLLVLTGIKWLGAIVPIGGLSFVLGWITLGIAAIRQNTGGHS